MNSLKDYRFFTTDLVTLQRTQIHPAAGWVVNIHSSATARDSEEPSDHPVEFCVSFTAPLNASDGTSLGQCVMVWPVSEPKPLDHLIIQAGSLHLLEFSLRVFLRRKGLTLGTQINRLPHEARSWWIVDA